GGPLAGCRGETYVSPRRLDDFLTLAAAPRLWRWGHPARRRGLTPLLDHRRPAFPLAAGRLTGEGGGDVVECGSYRGGSAAVLGQALTDSRLLWVFDSFQGMPEAAAADNFHGRGDFADTSLITVKGGLDALGIRYQAVPGFFAET